MWHQKLAFLTVLALVAGLAATAGAHLGPSESFDIYKLPTGAASPVMDGDLSDWKEWGNELGGEWTIQRIEQQSWFTACSMFNDTGVEPAGTALTPEDLATQNYMAWDDNFVYLGVEVFDNVYDPGEAGESGVEEAIALHLDTLHDGDGNTWVQGDFMLWTRITPARNEMFVRGWDAAGDEIAGADGSVEGMSATAISQSVQWEFMKPPVDQTAHNFDDPYGANYTFEVAFPIIIFETFEVGPGRDMFGTNTPPDDASFVSSSNNLPEVGRTWGFMIIIVDPDGTSGWGSQFCLFNGGDGNDDAFFGGL